MNTLSYANLEPQAALNQLNTSITTGLTDTDAKDRLNKFGSNEIKTKQIRAFDILIRQFQSSFMYLLLFAGAFSFLIGEAIDAIAIFIFVAVNAILGFAQEYRSEQALKLLKQLLVPTAKVLRDGQVQSIDARLLVPGDIVILETGDLVPADIRLIEANNISVNETAISGESVAINKSAVAVKDPITAFYEADNLVFTGTTIVRGRSRGVVIATGMNSTLGSITRLTIETVRESAFAKGIGSFSQFILRMIIVTLVFIFIANVAIKGTQNLSELIMFSIALAVSVIPEALPLVSTISLSRGALKLAKQKVVVRRLSAIEDLGGIEVLCTDKTGTITENKLTVTDHYGLNRSETLWLANLASAQVTPKVEPFDIALWEGLTNDQKQKFSEAKFEQEFPFDPVTRKNGAIAQVGINRLYITRGAVEEVISICSNLDETSRSEIMDWVKKEGIAGHRTLAIGYKNLNNSTDIERGINFTGVISFVDPIKASTTSAIKKANELNIIVKIITGDSPEVAGAVGQQIGIANSYTDVITGKELLTKSHEEQVELLKKYNIFARITPEQKHELVQKLQTIYEVGFLGEGINDAPALKAAGVSLVVPSASDIAREASDISLLANDLEVIVDGIREGRAIFTNTIKYLKATLGSNFGNFYAVALGSLVISFLPMLPLQILLLNLLSDLPMIAVATDTVSLDEVKKPQRYQFRDIIILCTVLGIVSTVDDFLFFGIFSRFAPATLQTNWFMGSILTELLFLFSIRTRLPFYKAQRPSWQIFSLTLLAATITIAIPYTYIGQTWFNFAPPSQAHLILILTLVGGYFIATELVKNLYYRYIKT